jgi:hypothetical protein
MLGLLLRLANSHPRAGDDQAWANSRRRVVHFLNASDRRFDGRSNVVHFLDAK